MKPITEKSSAGLWFEHFQKANAAGPPETVFDRMAARLIASHERTKRIHRGLKLGWSLEDLERSTAEELDAKTKSKPAGRHPGKLVRDLRAIRAKLGFTQIEFAEKYGLSTSTVQRIEAGHRVSKNTLGALKALLPKLRAPRQPGGAPQQK